jgi:type II secretion system protein E
MKEIEGRLLKFIQNSRILDSAELERVKSVRGESGENIDQVMVRLGLLTKERLSALLEEMSGYPAVDLTELDLEKGVLGIIPEETARKYQVVPLFKAKDSLGLAMVDPLDFEAIDTLRKSSGLTIEPFIATLTDVGRALDQHYGGRRSMLEMFEQARENKGAPLPDDIVFKGFEDEKESSQVSRMVNRLVLQAIREEASDIHIEPWEERLRVRYRIDGLLHDVPAPSLEFHEALISRIKILGGMNIAEKRVPQDGRVDIRANGREIGLRLSTYPTFFGEKIVIRLLQKDKAVTELHTLGFTGESRKRFELLVREPHGMIIVSGPTGSGKTTTLYAMLHKLKGVGRNIVTIEDPIEYQMDLICQSQVNPKAGMTFAMGLRAILRQDPDVIMVGEIRDRETAEIAIHSALTGHLVLSTLHTNDAAGAVARLIDIGIEPFLLASSLLGVIAQRLVRLVCAACREYVIPDDELLKGLGISRPGGEVVFARGGGCSACRGTGYRGRMGIFEMLVVDRAIRDLIAKGASSGVIRDAAVSAGMMELRQDGIGKALSGLTSMEEVLRATGSQ